MKVLILAAGRFGHTMRDAIRAGREPRLDVYELASVLDAEVLDYESVEESKHPLIAALLRATGPSPALAYAGYRQRHRFDAILTTGEDIGIPLSLLLRTSGAPCSHTMIAHTLSPRKKTMFFDYGGVERRMDRILVYSTSEERHAIERLRVRPELVERIYYHADQQFFRPNGAALEPDLVCAAGQLLRDYETLVEATRDQPVRVEIAAGSPWIEQRVGPKRDLPPNVKWGRLGRFDLRALYARSAIAVVPIFENNYQTGIATILEMMAMGKCVIATRTRGQTDTIVDGETGVYVPPGDADALRSAILRLIRDPAEAARLGAAARRFVEEHASLERFVARVSQAVKAGYDARASR